MKYFTHFNSAYNSMIISRSISAKAPFFVTVAGVTTGSKGFNFL